MNRQFISLTFLLVLSCSIQGMEILPQSSQGSGSGSAGTTIGSRTSKSSRWEPLETPVASAYPRAPQDTGSETVVTTTNQPAQPLLVPGGFPPEIWDKIISFYREQVEPISYEKMYPIPLVSRAWRDILKKEKYGVVIDVSKWSFDRINTFIGTVQQHQKSKDPRDYVRAEKVHGLDCHDNPNITDAVLQDIVATFPQLESLNLSQCESLRGNDFGMITQLTNLKKLDVSRTHISTEALQAIITADPNLEELSVSVKQQFGGVNWLPGIDLAYIADLHNLKKLDVSGTNISAAVLLAIVTANPGLEELSLGSCGQLPGNAFGHVVLLKKLKKLDVGDTNISATALQAIAAANKRLEELDISVQQGGFREVNWLSGTDLAHIADLHNLKKLNVSQTRISDTALLDIVTANKGLEELNLSLCEELLGDGFVHIARLEKLKKLNVARTHISGAALQAIVKKNHGIEELDLCRCIYPSDTDLAHIAELNNLKKLIVSETEISDIALLAIVKNNHGLEELDLRGCDQLSGEAFVRIARLKNLTNLKKLDVSHTNISAAALQAIVIANPGLEELILESVFKLPSDAFGYIAKLHKLKKLNVSETDINAAALQAIVTANPDLEEVDIVAVRTDISGATIGAIAAARPQLYIQFQRSRALGGIR